MNPLNNIAQKNKLTLGLVFPLESYGGSIPKMENQEALAQRVEELGFKALWFRDIPFHDPSFGDAGQMYDPWVYMTHIMHHTKSIVLATGSIVLPLRHPVHTAKSLFSIQKLSKGRVVMGVASGDRPIEYPAFNQNLENRAELFRQNFQYLKALHTDFPKFSSKNYGVVQGSIDVVPKAEVQTPILVTGHSGQNLEWIAEHADGWLYYPRNFNFLQYNMEDWHQALEIKKQEWKPFMQSLYLDLKKDKSAAMEHLKLGFSSGSDYVVEHLKKLESYGVSHVILNLKLGKRPTAEVIEELAESVVPHFK